MTLCSGTCGRTLIPKQSAPTAEHEVRIGGRGMCMGCYLRRRRNGDLEIHETPKVCGDCGRLMRAKATELFAHAIHERGGKCAACVRRADRPYVAFDIGCRGRTTNPDPQHVYVSGKRRFVTSHGAAQMLKCARSTLTVLSQNGELPRVPVQLDGRTRRMWLYDVEDVEALASRGPRVARDAILRDAS